MRIVHNHIIPFGKRFNAINIFGILFVKGDCGVYVVNHEQIHTAQMKELAYLPFYILYIVEWLIRLVQYRDMMQAYRNISFEREAYDHQHDLSYLHRRKHWHSFRSYLTKPATKALNK
jgi:hypothetical protein